MAIHQSAEEAVFSFGKFSGFTVAHIIRNSPAYLTWISNNESFDPVWKEAARLALNGEDISHLKLPRAKASPKADAAIKGRRVIEIVEKDDRTAKIFMPYDKSLIARFKAEVDGRKWNQKEKHWEFPIVHLPKVVDIIKIYEIKCTQKVKDLYAVILEDKRLRHEIREKDDTNFEITGLNLELFPFQKVGVEFIYQTGGKCLIADQPGLGKTIQSLAYANMEGHKTLAIVPLSVVLNWKKEIAKWLGKDTTVWTSKTVDGDIDNQFHVMNYDSAKKVHDVINKMNFDLLICDEATYLKNRQTIRAKAILGSWKERKKYPGIKTDHVIFLTGTPVMSRPIEAFSLLNFLDKDRFNNFYHFTQRYGGWKGVPIRNLTELHERTKDLTIRRKKMDVLSELADKQVSDLFIELNKGERKEYEKLLDELFKEWSFSGKPTIGTMPKIQGFLNDCKLPRVGEMIDEYLDNDRPLLVFCCYIAPLKKLHEKYPDESVMFHGSMSKEARQQALDSLTSGKKKVGLFSLKASGMGIDGLQHVIDTSIFLDRDWVPANHEQAEDRIHRIGQDQKVQIYYMTADDTIDDYMRELITGKRQMAAEIVDGEIIDAINSKSVFGEFVKKLKREHKSDD
jgi:SWI/SNF-related matrix-associated actin-dependent regulator 1 of chromatin subfamily A